MNRRGWLKLLGLAPVVPIAAALPAAPAMVRGPIRWLDADYIIGEAGAELFLPCEMGVYPPGIPQFTAVLPPPCPTNEPGEIYLGSGRLMDLPSNIHYWGA